MKHTTIQALGLHPSDIEHRIEVAEREGLRLLSVYVGDTGNPYDERRMVMGVFQRVEAP